MLPQIDVQGQQKLLQANVLVLGAGGLGCPALLYLVASGIGHIQIVDDDKIDLSNIQRQILYRVSDVGQKKTAVAQKRLSALQSDSKISVVEQLPDDNQLATLVKQADVVLDGTDSFAARHRHNRACVQAGVPLITGAVIRFEGQATMFNNKNSIGPCYHCLYPNAQDEQENCAENGILGSVAGMIANIMVTETIKLIVGVGTSISGRLLLFDALQMELRSVNYKRDPNCTVCKEA